MTHSKVGSSKVCLWKVNDGSRHFVVFSFVFSVFVNILMLTGPLFMLQVYDRVLGSRSEETLVALTILVVALNGLMWLLDFARTRLLARFGARLQLELDGKVFAAQVSAFPSRQTIAASAGRELEALQGFFASPAFVALMDLPFTPFFIALIFIFHHWLGWFAVAGGLALIATSAASQMLTSRRVGEARLTGESAYRFAENVRRASEIVRSQGMLSPLIERFVTYRSAALEQNMRAVDWTGAFSTFTKSFRMLLQSLVLALGAWLVLKGEITAGAMIATSIVLGRALAPIEQLIGRWPQIAHARLAWKSLSSFLEDSGEPVQRTRLPRPDGRLDFRGVTVTATPGGTPTLFNASFRLSPGEALGVIGRSGSGKTTIAKAILGLANPNVGEVRLGGALIEHYDAADLGAHIGYLPQDPVMLPGTIAENIARMSMSPDSAAVVDAAKKAKAHDLILSLPDGYETRVEENKVGLSGGQLQRIALARALYGDPVLLVLDEPNSALDQEGSDALNAAIREMKAAGQSVIIMTHRPVAISECDRLLVIDEGRVKADGPRDEVIRSMMNNAREVQRALSGTADR
jgi:ATP-binding cassette subfamily C protein